MWSSRFFQKPNDTEIKEIDFQTRNKKMEIKKQNI